MSLKNIGILLSSLVAGGTIMALAAFGQVEVSHDIELVSPGTVLEGCQNILLDPNISMPPDVRAALEAKVADNDAAAAKEIAAGVCAGQEGACYEAVKTELTSAEQRVGDTIATFLEKIETAEASGNTAQVIAAVADFVAEEKDLASGLDLGNVKAVEEIYRESRDFDLQITTVALPSEVGGSFNPRDPASFQSALERMTASGVPLGQALQDLGERTIQAMMAQVPTALRPHLKEQWGEHYGSGEEALAEYEKYLGEQPVFYPGTGGVSESFDEQVMNQMYKLAKDSDVAALQREFNMSPEEARKLIQAAGHDYPGGGGEFETDGELGMPIMPMPHPGDTNMLYPGGPGGFYEGGSGMLDMPYEEFKNLYGTEAEKYGISPQEAYRMSQHPPDGDYSTFGGTYPVFDLNHFKDTDFGNYWYTKYDPFQGVSSGGTFDTSHMTPEQQQQMHQMSSGGTFQSGSFDSSSYIMPSGGYTAPSGDTGGHVYSLPYKPVAGLLNIFNWLMGY